jgi:hypothetical protein
MGTANDLRFSPVERGEFSISFSSKMCKMKSIVQLIICEEPVKECMKMTFNLNEILILTFGFDRGTLNLWLQIEYFLTFH